jgi:regulator of nonsense transcripts 2
MKNQQQAEREEQQRIKNLVLNYDLRENEELDGDTLLSTLNPNRNIHRSEHPGHDKPPPYHTNRGEKLNRERGGQRIRRLQLSDVDWYARTHTSNDRNNANVQHDPEVKAVSASDMSDDKESTLTSSQTSMPDKRRKHVNSQRRPRNQSRKKLSKLDYEN